MLRVSRLADYASVVMTCLARQPREVLSAVQIAEATRLELPTVSKLLKQLAHANLVESFRGAAGGYRLARSPGEITLAEIVEALDGPIGMTDCCAAGCDRETHCDVSPGWRSVGGAVDAALRAVSLADMLRPVPAKRAAHPRAGA
ncbi:MAG TPA: SUF system Fe-S cluster assembly regulator [Rhodanobacteraceae bacterium]